MLSSLLLLEAMASFKDLLLNSRFSSVRIILSAGNMPSMMRRSCFVLRGMVGNFIQSYAVNLQNFDFLDKSGNI